MRKLKKYRPTKFKAKDSRYDSDAADFAVMFIESLCHTKGTWAGKPFELIDWQSLFCSAVGMVKNVPRFTAVPPTVSRQLSYLTLLRIWCGCVLH